MGRGADRGLSGDVYVSGCRAAARQAQWPPPRGDYLRRRRVYAYRSARAGPGGVCIFGPRLPGLCAQLCDERHGRRELSAPAGGPRQDGRYRARQRRRVACRSQTRVHRGFLGGRHDLRLVGNAVEDRTLRRPCRGSSGGYSSRRRGAGLSVARLCLCARYADARPAHRPARAQDGWQDGARFAQRLSVDGDGRRGDR